MRMSRVQLERDTHMRMSRVAWNKGISSAVSIMFITRTEQNVNVKYLKHYSQYTNILKSIYRSITNILQSIYHSISQTYYSQCTVVSLNILQSMYGS